MIFGCNPKIKKNNTIIGFVNGLQKGNLYLQKINDREFITLDSRSFWNDCQCNSINVKPLLHCI